MMSAPIGVNDAGFYRPELVDEETDAFGTTGHQGKLAQVMKDLIAIRDRARKG